MESVECYWLDESSYQRVSLHRWRRVRSCLGGAPVCSAKTPLTIVEGPHESGDIWPHTDFRWPRHCATCGFPFDEEDHFQLLHEPLYQRAGTDVLMTLAEAAPGAMWDAHWLRLPPGPDGLILCILLPDGTLWKADRPPSPEEREQGKKGDRIWTRTGIVPSVTIQPGVVTTSGWHGQLLQGRLLWQSPEEVDEDDED